MDYFSPEHMREAIEASQVDAAINASLQDVNPDTSNDAVIAAILQGQSEVQNTQQQKKMREECLNAALSRQPLSANKAMGKHRFGKRSSGHTTFSNVGHSNFSRNDPFKSRSRQELTPHTDETDFGATVLAPPDDGFFCRPLPLLSSRTSGLVMEKVQTDQQAVSALTALVEKYRKNCDCHFCNAGPKSGMSLDRQRKWWLDELTRLEEKCKTYTPAE